MEIIAVIRNHAEPARRRARQAALALVPFCRLDPP
jgi:hypothetical protein